MARLRFFLILLLSVALDFSSPVMPEGMEHFEEFEEQSHRARGRRLARLGHEASGSPVRPQMPQVAPRPVTAVRVAPATRRPVREAGMRKIPATFADSSTSAPEDQ